MVFVLPMSQFPTAAGNITAILVLDENYFTAEALWNPY
jgi:hypothetical protein